MVSKPRRTRHFSSLDLLLDHFWAKFLLPALHQKQKVYHLIPQVKELLIKIAWSTMMGVMKTLNVQDVQPFGEFICFCRYNFEMNSSVPLLTQSTNYLKWKVKMVQFFNTKYLYWVSNGLDRESFESEINWMNKCDVVFGTIALGLSPSLCYLSRSIKYP